MIITIENFGAIKYFQFDTEKDLYLIFGKNSVGKSYAISLVYLILKKNIELSDSFFTKHSISYFFKKCNADINDLQKKAVKNTSKEFNISSFIEKHISLYMSEFFVNKVNESLINTFNDFDNLQNNFSKDKLKIKIKFYNSELDVFFIIRMGLNNVFDLPEKPEKSDFNISNITPILPLLDLPIPNKKRRTELVIKNCFLSKPLILKRVRNCRKFKNADNQIVLYFPDNKVEHFEKSYFEILEKIASDSFNDSLIINDVYYLPASRSGLYQALSAFGQIFAQLANNRSFISKSVQLPAISEPLADYYLNLSSISSTRINHNFGSYAQEIEESILQGSVEFDTESKKLFFVPNQTSLKLDLSATSSMVSEISPIVSYIKYIFSAHWKAKDQLKTLVFIEEPEAHLHPETQVKLMEVFAKMVKDNKIKLVMTSHSNYIFNKASNLVMDNKIVKEKFAAVLFEPTPEGSIAKILETDEYGIEDENFIDTAESIYEERIELTNKLNS